MAGILISANADITWAKSFPHDKVFQVMSNGAYVVIYKDTGSGNLYYRTSTDSGATWSSAHALAGSPTEVGLCSIQVVSDKLYMWYAGVSPKLYTSAYDTGTNTFGAHTVYTYTFPGITNTTFVDATYVAGSWHVAIAFTMGILTGIAIFRTPGFDGTLATTQQFLNLQFTYAGLNVLTIIGISGNLYLAWMETSRKICYFAPITLSAFSYEYTPAQLETIAQLTDVNATFDVLQEAGGNQTLILNHETLLYSLTRTGTNSWGRWVPLQGQIVAGHVPATLLDGPDLYVGFESEVNEPNGETYLLKRTASRWTLPIVIAGGTSAGYKVPVLGPNTALYQDTSHNLYFLPWSPYSAPLAPTNLAPVGQVASLTPTVTWTSKRSSPTDPPKSHQVQTQRVSDSFLMDDSGEVLGLATSYIIPGGAGLVYNTAYESRVREKDSLSALGAGTWGPWSSWAIFTPVRGSVDTINSVTSGTVTIAAFPGTIAGTDLQLNVGHTQPDGDATNSYRIMLYDSDDVTLLSASAWYALGPPIASGSAFNTLDWSSGKIVNAHVYHASIQTADAVTGVISESAHVQLTSAFTPPASPSALTATVDDDEGSVLLTWGNAGDVVSIMIEWQPYTWTGTALGWMPIGATGQLWNQADIRAQAPQCKADYRVTAYNALGVASAPSTITGVFLDNALDYAAIWINDASDPANRKVYVGTVDNWDALKRDRVYAMEEWVPMGSQTPIHTFGLTNYWIFGTSQALKTFFPFVDIDSHGNPHYGADNRDMALSLSDTHATCFYRDRRMPIPVPVKFIAYEDEPNDDINDDLTLELHQTSYFGQFPVLGSLV